MTEGEANPFFVWGVVEAIIPSLKHGWVRRRGLQTSQGKWRSWCSRESKWVFASQCSTAGPGAREGKALALPPFSRGFYCPQTVRFPDCSCSRSFRKRTSRGVSARGIPPPRERGSRPVPCIFRGWGRRGVPCAGFAAFGKYGERWVKAGSLRQRGGCVVPVPQRRAGCSQRGALQRLRADAEPFSSGSGFASCPARSLVAKSPRSPAAKQPAALPLRSIPAPAAPRRGTKFTLPPRPRCSWVAGGETGPFADALPIPASRCFPRASAGCAPRGGSQAWEGKSQNWLVRDRDGAGGAVVRVL